MFYQIERSRTWIEDRKKFNRKLVQYKEKLDLSLLIPDIDFPNSLIHMIGSSFQGRILRRRRGVSLLTYIFSISFKGRLDPSGKLTNFQPPPPPRFPRGPSFSTVKFHPFEGRLLLYLWHFTSPAICKQAKESADFFFIKEINERKKNTYTTNPQTRLQLSKNGLQQVLVVYHSKTKTKKQALVVL